MVSFGVLLIQVNHSRSVRCFPCIYDLNNSWKTLCYVNSGYTSIVEGPHSHLEYQVLRLTERWLFPTASCGSALEATNDSLAELITFLAFAGVIFFKPLALIPSVKSIIILGVRLTFASTEADKDVGISHLGGQRL